MELIADPLENILPAVIKALNHGASVNGRFDNAGRDTPLTHAAGFGQLPAIKLFLERGARINQANDDGQTPLWNAAETGMLEAQDTSDVSNFKPATQAQIQKRREIYTDIVRTLLKHGAQTEIADKNGATPLSVAAFRGRREIVEVLLEAGANPNHRDEYGKTPLEWAAYNGYSKVVEVLQTNGAKSSHLPGVRQRKLDEALRDACEKGDLQAVQLLLYRKADANAYMTYWPEDAPPYMNGFTTPLLQSVASPAITRRLLEAGANPDGQDDHGATPLMQATGKVAELLLDKGAKIDARDHEGMTPLMHRAAYNDFAAVQVLLKYGADVKARDNFGQTVLMTANEVNRAELPTTANQVNVLEMLIAHGATINAHDDAGQTALMAATFVPYGEGAVCNPVLARVLMRHGADRMRAIIKAILP